MTRRNGFPASHPQTNRTSDLPREPVTRPNARAVRVRIVESEDRGAANTRCIGKPSDEAIGDCGRTPCGWRGFGYRDFRSLAPPLHEE